MASLWTAAGPQLKVISQIAVGFDNIDVPEATPPRHPRRQHARGTHRDHGRRHVGAHVGRGPQDC